MECPLLHGNKKNETITEKLTYYDFRRFRGYSNRCLQILIDCKDKQKNT